MRQALGKGLDALLGSSFEMEQELNGGKGKRIFKRFLLTKSSQTDINPERILMKIVLEIWLNQSSSTA